MPRRADAARALRPKASAPVFAALGDETRLRLVSRLSSGGPMSIAALAKDEDVTRQAITKHLRVMEDAGLVSGSREGRESIFRLETDKLIDAREALERIAGQWDDALLRLKKFVEE